MVPGTGHVVEMKEEDVDGIIFRVISRGEKCDISGRIYTDPIFLETLKVSFSFYFFFLLLLFTFSFFFKKNFFSFLFNPSKLRLNYLMKTNQKHLSNFYQPVQLPSSNLILYLEQIISLN